MLRITTEETGESIRLRLEGDLKGAWVSELERLYTEKRPGRSVKSVIVDLRSVTSSDTAGKYLLALIHQDGAVIECLSPLRAQLLMSSPFGQEESQS